MRYNNERFNHVSKFQVGYQVGTTLIVQVMRRVLITDGAGFIGSSLVNALMISRNCNIRGFSILVQMILQLSCRLPK